MRLEEQGWRFILRAGRCDWRHPADSEDGDVDCTDMADDEFETTLKEITMKPQGYRLEFKAGEYCFYTPEDFAREVNADTARIWGLFVEPQPGCSNEPAAWRMRSGRGRGNFWCEARYWTANAYMDPEAVPMYLGPVLSELGKQ